MATTAVTTPESTTPQKREYTNLEQVLWSKGFEKDLAHFLGSPSSATAYIAEIFNQARKVPDLHACTVTSIAHGIAKVASLRLNPALPNMVHFIPRNNKQPDNRWAKELTIEYGYAGLRTLVVRSPEVADCWTSEVCVNDTYAPPATLGAPPVHVLPPRFHPRGRVEGYYAVIELTNGNYRHQQMSVAQVEAHWKQFVREGGPAWQKGKRPDVEDGLTTFDKMALKTVLRMLCNGRDVPLTAEVQDAFREGILRETAAEHQGYDRSGQRPALTPSTGMPLETLRDEVYGTHEQAVVAAQVAAAVQGTPPPPPEVQPEEEPRSDTDPNAWRDRLAQAGADMLALLEEHPGLPKDLVARVRTTARKGQGLVDDASASLADGEACLATLQDLASEVAKQGRLM